MSNIEKIKKLQQGIHNRKVQIGYEGKTISQRKEGEEWTDARGRSWKIEDGKRKQLTKVPPRGFDKCSDCKKLILKKSDTDVYNRFQKCRVCQLEFEALLHHRGEWQEWVTEMEKERWEKVLAEYEYEMNSAKESKSLKFDKTVANAIAKESHR